VKRFFVNLLAAVGDYLLFAVGGTILLLAASTVIGYLPYSDRPGPGWYDSKQTFSFGQVWYFVNWGAFLALYAYVVGLALFLGAWVLASLRSPRWLIAVLGGLAAGYVSFYLVAATGWYIAISPFPVYGAGILGLFFGGWLLPRHASAQPDDSRLRLRHRVGLYGPLAVMLIGVGQFLISRASDQRLEVVYVLWEQGTEPLSVKDFPAIGSSPSLGLTEKELAQLRELRLTGRLIVRGGSRHGEGQRSARAVIIMYRQLDSPVVLPQPDGTSLIHLQTADGWRMLPSDALTLKRTLELEIPPDNPETTFLWIDLAGSGRQGSDAFYWSRPNKGGKQ